MTQRKPGEHARQAAMTALKRLKNNRAYALDDGAQLALGAIAEANREAHGLSQILPMDVEPLMQRLAAFDFLGLVQERPGPEEKLEWPTDPVTGEKLPNPFASGGNLGDRNAVFKLNPKLATYFERLVKDGPWKLHLEHLQKTAEVAELAAIKYGEAEHKANPFKTGSAAEQAAFIKEHSPDFPNEGLRVAFYRREADDIRCPWSAATKNRYQEGLMLKSDPELGALAQRAAQIEQQWLAEQKQIAAQEEAEAKARLAAIQARMGHGPTPSEQDHRAQLAHEAAQRR